jgi:replication factor A1
VPKIIGIGPIMTTPPPFTLAPLFPPLAPFRNIRTTAITAITKPTKTKIKPMFHSHCSLMGDAHLKTLQADLNKVDCELSWALRVDLEQIVQRILLARRDITRDEVLRLIYEKKRSAEDYFLDEVAARIVASELGVEVPREEEPFKSEISVTDLVSGLNDVTLTARVIEVYPIQTFIKPDLTEGKIARLLLADKSGTLRLVLWNDKISLIEAGKIRRGNIARVLHGYVREGFDGKMELHLGQRGDVQVSPADAIESDYPPIDSFIDKIGNLTQKSKRASVLGLVNDVYPASEFNRKDGTTGKVRRLKLRDETGEISLVFWNEKVNELGEVKNDDQLRIINARIKTQPDDKIELHIENSTQIEKSVGQTLPLSNTPSETKHKIADLKEEGGPFTIEATVVTPPDVREITTTQKEKVLLTSFELADDTGKIGISLWRKHAELGKELSVGTQIKIKNAYAKKGFSNLLELVSRTSTTIEIVSKP